MKKLAIIVCACSLIFAGCQNKEVKTDETAAPEPQEEQMCPEMQKKKAMCEAWQQWDQQTDEMKAELIADRKAKIAECEAKKAECGAKKAEFEAKKAEFEKTWAENWAKFDELGIEEQKALIDNYMMFNCPKHCCKGEGAPGCKHGEGAPKCKHGEGPCQHNPAQCPNHDKPECPHHAK